MAFEAVMRVRASRGVKVSAFHGNHFLRGADLLALPTCDQDKGFSCELAHEEQNLSCSHILIQAALLYTSSDGERRIRVHNLNLPVTQNMSDMYSLVDVPATMNSLLKTAVEQARSRVKLSMKNREDVY
jgi:protein transport protein SEC24